MINMEEEKDVIYNAIKDQIVSLAFHPKGNYVLLLTMQLFKGDQFEFCINKLLEVFPKLVLDQFGICIANKLI